MSNDKELVRELGERIGYGNMMHLASDLWKEMLSKDGYPASGAFIPVIEGDFEYLKQQFSKLTDEQRMDLLDGYCKFCGSDDSDCQCWNDE